MPELPEVETVCRGLRIKIIGKKIALYQQYRGDLRWRLPSGIKETVEGTIIKAIERKGKYLLINLNNDYTVIIHLGMSGRLLVYDSIDNNKITSHKEEMGVFFHTLIKLGKHDHVKIYFNDGGQMVFNDVRRFGAIDMINTIKLSSHKWLSKLGPEPLSNSFSSQILRDKTSDVFGYEVCLINY